MTKQSLLAVKALAVGLFFLFAGSSIAHAQATRTWVSGVGDDVNPCSRTAPCKTFAGAYSRTAAGGEIDVLDPGGYGAVTISKALTINGSGGSIAGLLVSGTNAIVVAAGANDVVTIRNLDIDGIGTGLNGIRFISGKELHVEDCLIFNFAQIGIDFEPNTANPSQLLVSDTVLLDNAGGGVFSSPTNGATAKVNVSRVMALNNTFGVRGDNSQVAISDSVVSGNSSNGFFARSTGPATTMFIEHSVATNNGLSSLVAGVRSDGAAAIVRINDNTIVNNSVGLLSNNGGQIVSAGNNDVFGNTTDGSPTSVVPLK